VEDSAVRQELADYIAASSHLQVIKELSSCLYEACHLFDWCRAPVVTSQKARFSLLVSFWSKRSFPSSD